MRHTGFLLTFVFVTGLLFGSAAMFYLVKAEIVLPGFDFRPYLLAWFVFLVAWLLGRFVDFGNRDDGSHKSTPS